MHIQQNIPLAPYTTFNIGGSAEYFVVVKNTDELQEALEFAKEKSLNVFVLGGGSNILISDAGIKGLVIHIEFRGISIVNETSDELVLDVAAGENWDKIVELAASKKWQGIENLSHIPGSMGGVPVQNVGAYGQEASQVVLEVTTFNIEKRIVEKFTNAECKFGYRSSIFNRERRGEFVILTTNIVLKKNGQVNLSYGDVKKYFEDRKIENPSLLQIRQAITEIRDTKFPFPEQGKNGSAGSFFNAPSIPVEEFESMVESVTNNFGEQAKDKIENMRDRLVVPQGMKVPFGFLIEICGLKGYAVGGASVCQTHAGVIVNILGTATSADVLCVFQYARSTVFQKTGVTLKNEPELVGFTAEELEKYLVL